MARRAHRELEGHKDLVAGERVGPIVFVQWLVQRRTSVDCSGPIAASNQGALEEVRRREQVGLLVEADHTAVAEDSPGAGSPGPEGVPEGGNLAPEEGSLDLEAGSPGVGHRDFGFRSMNRKVSGHRGPHRPGHRCVSLGEGRCGNLMKLGFVSR